MNGRKTIEWGVVAAVSALLSVGGTLLARREARAAEFQQIRDRIAAVEALSLATASALKIHVDASEKGYQALYSLESDVRDLRSRQEWVIATIAEIARRQGIHFAPPPPSEPLNRGPGRGNR